MSDNSGAAHMKSVREIGFVEFFKLEQVAEGVPKKSSIVAAELRRKGNKIYRDNNKHDEKIHKQILSLYSKSIAYAPYESEELAQGYSNRSVLLKHLHKYQESITDIDRALQLTKSYDLKNKLILRKVEYKKLMENYVVEPKRLVDEDELQQCNTLISMFNERVKKFNLKDLVTLPSSLEYEGITKKLELPSITPSKDIPCMADCVSLEYNKTHGRHMVATRDIKPGEIIGIAKGYVLFPKKYQQYLVCSHCLNFAWNGIPCKNCPCVFFCSEDCRDQALEEYHDVECCILPFLLSKCYINGDISKIYMTQRLFIKAIKKEGLENIIKSAVDLNENDMSVAKPFPNDIFCYEKFSSFYKLIDCKGIKTFVEDVNFFCSMILCLLCEHTTIFDHYKDEKSQQTLKQAFKRFKSILDTNSKSFHEFAPCKCPDMLTCQGYCPRKMGSIFIPICCFFNHSCASNVSRIFTKGGRIVLFTLQPVKKGEQLCLSYGPNVNEDKKTRNEYLKECFSFSCKCQACIENWPLKQLKVPFQCMDLSNSTNIYTKFQKFIGDENISLMSIYNDEKDYFNETTMKDNIKVVEYAYKNYKPSLADSLSAHCKIYIQEAFEKFYGTECEMPSDY